MRKKLGRNHSRLSRPSTSGWDAHQTVGPVRQESTPRRRSRPWAIGHISICIESGMGQFSVCRRSESTTTPTANPLRQMGSPCRLPPVVGEPSFSDRRRKRARPKAFRICVSRSMLIGIGVARLEISDLVLRRIGAGCSPRRGDTEQGTVSSNKMIHHLDRFGLLGGGSHR